MTLQEALRALEAKGNDKTRAHNKKFGASDNQYGAKMGDIRALGAKIKKDHALALELWATENVDAQLLAMLIIDPQQLEVKDVDRMVRQISFSQVADWFSANVLKEYKEKETLREMWMKETDPWAARAGWGLTSGRIARSPEGLDIKALLDRIEKEMPKAPAPTQWNMNSALAQIGIHHPAFRERSIAIGEKLGIYRDYPVSKGCTSPFAPIWIGEMVRRSKGEGVG
jgi:3-methyladenine DNA glycosylase AlkD